MTWPVIYLTNHCEWNSRSYIWFWHRLALNVDSPSRKELRKGNRREIRSEKWQHGHAGGPKSSKKKKDRQELKSKQFIWEGKGTRKWYREGKIWNKWCVSSQLPPCATELNPIGGTCKNHVDTRLRFTHPEGWGSWGMSVIGWVAPGKHCFMGSKVTYSPEKSSSKEMQVL